MLHSDKKCGSLEERFFQSVLQMNFPSFFSITQRGGRGHKWEKRQDKKEL